MNGGPSQTARLTQVPRFDWDEHNAELDRRLAAWNEDERKLSELHIKTARELREALP